MHFRVSYKPLVASIFVLASFMRLAAQEITASDTMQTTTMHGTYYSDRFVGRKTSSGEVFSQEKYTAAHNSLPFGTLLLVTNPNNGKQVIVRINDRCPKRNILDMSRKAAKQIGIGSLNIQVTILPQRFLPYWEAQDDIVDVMTAGDFWKYCETHTAPDLKRGSQPAKPGAGSATKTDRKEHIKDEQHDTDVKLYNIELCRCKSRNTAKKKVEQMPIYYQDKVDYKSNMSTNEVIIMLSVSFREEKALSVIKELSGLFPDAKLVKISQ